jgi:hypothetical protein
MVGLLLGWFLGAFEREKQPSQIRETFYVADPGLRIFEVLSGMRWDREEASHRAIFFLDPEGQVYP